MSNKLIMYVKRKATSATNLKNQYEFGRSLWSMPRFNGLQYSKRYAYTTRKHYFSMLFFAREGALLFLFII
jgi:hypothetical protein